MTTVKVSNVSLGATKRDLMDVFFFAGAILYLEMQSETERTKLAYVTFKDLQRAENAVLFSGATIVGSSVIATMAPDYRLSPEALASLVPKGVTIQLMFPTHRIGHVIGKSQANIKAIMTDTGANVSIGPLRPEYKIVTISSLENIQGLIQGDTSPILSAARCLIDLCMIADLGNHEVTIIVKGSDMTCIDAVAIAGSTGAFIDVCQR